MEKTITIEIDPATALDTLKRIWRPVYRATIVSYRLKRAKIESRAFFRQAFRGWIKENYKEFHRKWGL